MLSRSSFAFDDHSTGRKLVLFMIIVRLGQDHINVEFLPFTGIEFIDPNCDIVIQL
jgi:hypothetical protein